MAIAGGAATCYTIKIRVVASPTTYMSSLCVDPPEAIALILAGENPIVMGKHSLLVQSEVARRMRIMDNEDPNTNFLVASPPPASAPAPAPAPQAMPSNITKQKGAIRLIYAPSVQWTGILAMACIAGMIALPLMGVDGSGVTALATIGAMAVGGLVKVLGSDNPQPS